jgi:hypothetical protein
MQKSYLYTPSTAHKSIFVFKIEYSHENSEEQTSYQGSPFSNKNRRNQSNISSKVSELK